MADLASLSVLARVPWNISGFLVLTVCWFLGNIQEVALFLMHFLAKLRHNFLLLTDRVSSPVYFSASEYDV